MDKKKFWANFIVWLVFALVVPIAAICYKYELVKDNPIKYTGWGILVILIIAIVVMAMLGYLLKLMKWSMTKQIIAGFRNVVFPIILLFLGSNLIANNIENIKFILLVSLFSEAIAIPFNPFPKWVYEKNISDLKEAIK